MTVYAQITEVEEILTNRRPFMFLKTYESIPYYITVVEIYSDGKKTGRELSMEISHVYQNLDGMKKYYKLLIPGEIEVTRKEVADNGKDEQGRAD